MDKSKKNLVISGEIFPNDAVTVMQAMADRPSIYTPTEPPKNFKEFEDRLGIYLVDLYKLFFGLIYDVESGKTIKRKKDDETLLDALCNCDKFSKEVRFVIEGMDHYSFLRNAIERDAPFVIYDDIYLLGVERDRSGLFLPEKNKIAIQIAAQVHWNLEKNKIPTIENMKDFLQNKKNLHYSLLQIQRFNARTICDWIRDVFPVPKDSRKGRPSKNGVPEDYFNDLTPIPGVFFEDCKVINFLKLRFTIIFLARVLKNLGWSIDHVKKSKFIHIYQSPLRFYPYNYVNDWLHAAYNENGSIFSP